MSTLISDFLKELFNESPLCNLFRSVIELVMDGHAVTAQSEPKAFKKSPVKYQYRLAAGVKAKSSEWTGGQGKVLSVLSSVAYLTARDVANQLRIEPHVAQGLLQRLLVRGAVERRIIPGSVHDLSTKVAEPPKPLLSGFGAEFIPGAIIAPSDSIQGDARYIITGINDNKEGFTLYGLESTGAYAGQEAHWPSCWRFIEQTPNPIAFNQGRYAECFAAPVVEPVEELKTADGFVVGDIVALKCDPNDPYEIKVVYEDGNAFVVNVGDTEVKFKTDEMSKTGVWERFADKTKDNLVAAISEKVDEATKPQPKFKVGDRVEVIGNKYFGDGTIERVDAPPFGHYRVRHDNGLGDSITKEHDDGCGGWAESSLRAIDRPAPKRFYVAHPELLPNDALSEVSKVFGFGADKYARDDWAKPNNGGGDHLEAAFRHIDAHRNGRLIESGENGSGLPHLWHAAARLLMAIGKEMRNR